ncbi:dynein light chain Tctex-type 5-like [Hydractinia symbiolongicarpus]|uniref:dynein light chain Tctex-type 5-like n=1 Tax=Hydractinia symbiolongicarpus TaxID=13093 RepID=UPI00254EC641|nr:dynein light chain Tctex-type 5-like [Hydractinia symbiolongicarpus]
MAQNKLVRRETPKINQGLSIAKVFTVSFAQGGKRDTLAVSNYDKDKPTPLSLIASPTIIRKFRRRVEEYSPEEKRKNASYNAVDNKQCITEQYLRAEDFNVEEERPRSSTWGGQEGSLSISDAIPHVIMNADPTVNDKIKRFTLNMERKSKSCKKLRELVEKVLRKNLEHCHYDARLSRKRCTHLSQILETTFKSSLNVKGTEYKVVAIVYIGEIREDGMKQSCQYNWNPHSDVFVMETYRRDDMFATGIVFATLLESREDIDSFYTFDERLENDEMML